MDQFSEMQRHKKRGPPVRNCIFKKFEKIGCVLGMAKSIPKSIQEGGQSGDYSWEVPQKLRSWAVRTLGPIFNDFDGFWQPRGVKGEDLLYGMLTSIRALGRLLEAPWNVFGACRGIKGEDLLYGIAFSMNFKKKRKKLSLSKNGKSRFPVSAARKLASR